MDDDKIVNSGTEPKVEAGLKNFKIKVSRNGIDLGWWTNVGGTENWITVTDKAGASVWYQVFYQGSTFLGIGSNNYLSYRTRGASGECMKMRGWAYAAKWELVGKNLKCLDNGKLVGVEGDYFYVNGENVVDVEYVPV
jgi:hypothetical protein